MAITYPLALPTATSIATITLRAINSVAVSRSPFTFKEQVFIHSGKRWEADITLPVMQEDNAEAWVTFLLSLRGQRGTFLLGDPVGATPRGSASGAAGTPVVNGATQTGDTLDIDGCPVSATGYLKAGDYIQLGTGNSSRLYKVLADVDTDGSGQATLDIWPSIVTAPSDGATVVVSGAKGAFRLASNSSEWNINELALYGITFGAVQAIA